MSLKASTTRVSVGPYGAASRCPGRSRSTVSIVCASRSSGAKARRSSTNSTSSAMPSPAMRITASTSAMFALIVIGVTISSAVITTSTTPLAAKMRQNKESRGARTGGCDKLAGSLGLGLGKAQLRPPASLRRRDHHRTRGRTFKRPRERRAPSPAQPPLSRRSQDDDVSALLGGDLSKSPGPISHPRPSLYRPANRGLLHDPGEQPLGAAPLVAAPHIRVCRHVGGDQAQAETISQRCRELQRIARARRVVHTAYDRSAQRHQISRGQRFDETEQRSTFAAVAHMGR